MRTTRSLIIFSIATVLLLVPLIAMQLSTEVDWSTGDFLLAALLLFGTGTAIEIAFRKVAGTRKRLFAIGLILFLLLLIWAELAVGIFGTSIAGS